ncbi:MAG: hypothetical protein QOG44_1827 [Acidimicrobiaceae bacterium]|jgi:hypothetical protein|nr:hypothetical protein [Acidimicrobiaceae bacterium]
MKLQGHQTRHTNFIGEADHYGHTPLATEIREGLVIIDDVEVVKYVGRPAQGTS